MRPLDPARSTERYQVSVNGGREPKWRGDGRELFYRDEIGRVLSATVSEAAGRFEASVPQLLFQMEAPLQAFDRDTYDVTADGQRFLVNSAAGRSDAAVRIITGWR